MKTISEVIEVFPSTTETDWHQHKNGGGWVHSDAEVSPKVFVSGAIIRGGWFEGGTFKGGLFEGGWFKGGTFKGGTFKGGTFMGGTFEGGTFEGGTFKGGTFEGGWFEGGTFKGGTFKGGTFMGGWFEGGTFKGGTFEGGWFEGGTFKGGTFKGGTFMGGTFKGGTWTRSPVFVICSLWTVGECGTNQFYMGCRVGTVAELRDRLYADDYEGSMCGDKKAIEEHVSVLMHVAELQQILGVPKCIGMKFSS